MTDTQKNNNNIDYHHVEAVINKLVLQKLRPSAEKIKQALNITTNEFDEIIEYFHYMWEQRHTTTYLTDIEPLKPSELQTKEFAKRTLQLEESLGMMRATIEATEDCLIMINKEGKLVGYNKKLADFVGLPESVRQSKDETEGLNYLFSQIADPQELAQIVMRKYQDPTPGPCGEMLFKDGRTVERYYQPQIVKDRVVGHIWSLRDVTEKRKQEESLRLANRAIDSSTHGIILIENNPQFIITYLNPASTRLLHIDEINALQKPFLTISDGFSEHLEEFIDIFKEKNTGDLTIQCRMDGKINWLEINIDPVYGKTQEKITHFVAIINDITKNKELENILQYKAVHDTLTGLPNKAYIEDAIRYRIKKAVKNSEQFGVLFIDIDRFKNINDTLGHHIGDNLLCLFGKRIQNILQKQDILARIGGDEFIILISSIYNSEDLNAIAARLMESSRRTFSSDDHEFNITISIGIVCYPECGRDSETLIRNADIAMYQAKYNGRNQTFLYNASLNHTITRRMQIENELHNSIVNHEFELHYQPIYNVNEKRFVKAEALLRWKNKKLGNISPTEFIPVIEDIGMITMVGRWIIEQVMQQMTAWKNTPLENIMVSINVSAKQLSDENFVSDLNKILHTYNLSPQKVLFEITESFLLLQEKVTNKLTDLHNLGVKIAIDDFGTGYSNLSYLNKLHIHSLKIDKSFIDQIDMNHFDDSVLLAIIAIAKRMKFKIIAEGVETQKQLDFLTQNQCDEIQGYYFSKPLNIADFEGFLKGKV